MIKRALISVSDKTGVADLAKRLAAKGVEVLSTGGTAKLLREAGVAVKDVSEFTGFPEMMNGRVKTLHPKVHGGLLGLRDNPEHIKAAQANGIEWIDLLVVNLYPFAETVKKPGVTEAEAIEQIDIGGPSMLRSAAKNFKFVTVVSDPADYGAVLHEIEAKGDTTPETRRKLAEKVFALTAQYDAMIAGHLTGGTFTLLPALKVSDLRYGENPHQKAAFYRNPLDPAKNSLTEARILQGKEPSYNNILDTDAALNLIREFKRPAVAFIKHTNPCGVAIAEELNDAFVNAFGCDPKSAFGGIVALNRPCTKDLAEAITAQFFEVVVAPEFAAEALEVFKRKPNLRVLAVGVIEPLTGGGVVRSVAGGYLMQDRNVKVLSKDDVKVVTKKAPTPEQITDLMFAWKVAKHVKSNAIVLAKNGMTVGIGAGQMSRVDSVEIALHKANGREKGTVMASDAFFPFADSVEAAAGAGIAAIVQPGGSIKDAEVIASADKHGIAMVFTGSRAFLH